MNERARRGNPNDKNLSTRIESPRRREEVEGFLNCIDGLIKRYNPNINGDQALYSTPVIPAKLRGDSIEINIIGKYNKDRQIVSGTIHIQKIKEGKKIDVSRGLRKYELPDDRTMRIMKSLLKAVRRLYNKADKDKSVPRQF